MTWEQVHIFLDIAATVGGCLVGIIGYIAKTSFKNASEDLAIQLNRLELRITSYEATCTAERAELFRVINGRGSSR